MLNTSLSLFALGEIDETLDVFQIEPKANSFVQKAAAHCVKQSALGLLHHLCSSGLREYTFTSLLRTSFNLVLCVSLSQYLMGLERVRMSVCTFFFLPSL